MLRLRILSALVMAPPALLATWWGGYPFAVLVAVAAAIMCWEWHKMVSKGFALGGWVAAGLCAASSLAALAAPTVAVTGIAAAALASAALAPGHGERPRLWAGLGALYCGLPAVALVWLRGDGPDGWPTMLWLMLLVWGTDIGAYAAGRTIGGPLLLPKVSPKKTWAGLLGGMASAALAGLAIGWAFGAPQPGALAVTSAILAVVAQAGDLMESWVKRRCGVKDSSNIIPGHGGVLDRVDGLLFVALAVAAAMLVSGQPILSWQ